jgi:hypothetical protein
MHYTKMALLTFGAGLILALGVVASGIDGFGRVASAAMALGIAAVPVGMIVDWRIATRSPRQQPIRRGKTRARHSPSVRRAPRPRKPARRANR